MSLVIKQRSVPVVEHSLGGYPEFVQRLLLARGISDSETLDFKLKHLLPPSSMKGMEVAAALLSKAVQRQQRILIVGDFDADGATSTALSVRCLRALGAQQVDYLVPNRFEYGYGLSPEIVREAAKYQPDLIMTVDNGISSIEGVEEAKRLGIPVLVTDHHLAGNSLPDAAAIVNPNQPDCSFLSKAMAGVGVAFYLMLATRAKLRDLEWFQQGSVTEPNMAQFLDLVAVGTVSDLVPLDQNNRIMVAMGLERIRSGKACAGIYALLNVAKRLPKQVTSTDIGFAIGPRINAAGRLDDMSEGIECLLADDADSALELAGHLDTLNRERKTIEVGMKEEAERYVERMLASQNMPKGLVVYQQDWHEGVIGIVASRVKERFYRPVIAFAESGDVIKGSARSIPGLHIRDCLDLVDKAEPGMILKFGGHAMAAGLTIKSTALDRFRIVFNDILELHYSDVDFEQVLMTDGDLDPSFMTLPNAELLTLQFPWGQLFPEPIFEGVFQVVSVRVLNGGHIKWVLVSAAGESFDAIYFNVKEIDVLSNTTTVRLCYRLSVNEFRERRSLQLMVEHAISEDAR